MTRFGRPWEFASRKQINTWVRDAAMSLFTSDDFDAWTELRRDEGWTDEDCKFFLIAFDHEIQVAHNQLERWFDGEGSL